MLMNLGGGWSPLLGVILLDLFLSPAEATVTKAGPISYWGGSGREGFPQITFRGGETVDQQVNA